MISEAVPSAVLPTPLAVLYRHVWTHAEGARGRLAAALAMLGSSQLLKLAMPWMAAQAINSIQVAGRAGLQTAAGWIGAILVLHLGVWCLHGPARVMERSVALRVRRSIADALYTRLAHAPLAWHDGHHSGDLQHRVGQASGALYGFTESQFIYLQNLINVVGPLLALYWLSPLTAAMALIGFLLSGVVIVRFDSSLMKLAERENAAERRYAARLIDFVGNISAVASLRLQEATRRLLDSKLAAVFLPLQRSIVLTEWKWCAVDLLTVGVSWALVMIYAASMAASQAPAVAGAGGLLIGSLFMVYQYAQQAAGVLCSMASNYQNLARTQTDFASADIIHEAPMPAAVLEGHHSGWQRLELKDLSYRHARSERGGIEGVTLTLQRGERLALVGESGSGKSTLLRVLAGLYHADRGAVAIDGFVQPGRRHAGDLATLLPQEAEVFEASMRENITLDQVVSESDVQKAVHASALDTVVAGLPQGLDTAMSERGFNLSGGQRQRLALARGVLAARHSSLLLLDEPTSALDAITEHLVHQRLASAFPRACIVAAVHRLELLPRFDRVAFMAAGRVVDIGTADELSARQPRFAALCKGTEAARRATARAAAI